MELRITLSGFCALCLLALAGCNPAYNWRQIALGGDVQAMLPCKPDSGQKKIELLGQTVRMQMQGCEAGGAMFVLAQVQLDRAEQTRQAQAHWQLALLTHLKAKLVEQRTLEGRRTGLDWPALWIEASGQGADAQPLRVQAAWLAKSGTLYHAAIYGQAPPQQARDMFFSGFGMP